MAYSENPRNKVLLMSQRYTFAIDHTQTKSNKPLDYFLKPLCNAPIVYFIANDLQEDRQKTPVVFTP
jgi:hypothetical protein